MTTKRDQIWGDLQKKNIGNTNHTFSTTHTPAPRRINSGSFVAPTPTLTQVAPLRNKHFSIKGTPHREIGDVLPQSTCMLTKLLMPVEGHTRLIQPVYNYSPVFLYDNVPNGTTTKINFADHTNIQLNHSYQSGLISHNSELYLSLKVPAFSPELTLYKLPTNLILNVK